MIKDRRLLAVIASLIILVGTTNLFASDPEKIKVWIQQLHKPTANAKLQAAARLADAGDLGSLTESALEGLAVCLKDPNTDVRVYAAYALGRIGAAPERTISLLAPLLSETNEHVRYSAEWSISEVAKAIASQPISDIAAKNMLGVFTSLEEQMARVNAQERHTLAVRLARIRLEAHAGNVQNGNLQNNSQVAQTEPPRMVELAPIEANPSLEHSMLASISLYEANDIAGRLQLIDRMSNDKSFDDDLRLAVLKHELQSTDPSAVYYAMKRWKPTASRLISKLCAELNDQDLSTQYAENVIQFMEPSELSHWQLLFKIARETKNNQDIRIASLAAVERTLAKQAASEIAVNFIFDELQRLISEGSEKEEIRVAATRAMAEVGPKYSFRAAPLLKLVTQPELSKEMRTALAATLAKIAPNSQETARVLAGCMRDMQIEDALFRSFAESMGEFKLHGQIGLPSLVLGLRSKELDTRLVCAKTLERLGKFAVESAPAVVALITDPDEKVVVKSQAAKTLKEFGDAGLELLSRSLANPDPLIREHVLRAMVPFANTNDSIAQICIRMLSDKNEAVTVRAAAASTLGSVGPQAANATPALTLACDESEPTAVRSSAIIALARIDREGARTMIDANLSDSEFLIRASSAFALHWCGTMSESIDALLALLDGTDNDELIRKTIQDLGPFASAGLLEVAKDSSQSIDARLCCVEALIAIPPVAWNEIIKLLEDDDIGDLTASMIESGDLFESEVADRLVELLRSGQLRAATRYRIVKIFEANGFGAADDDEPVWEDTFAINQPRTISHPSHSKSNAKPSKSMAMPVLEESDAAAVAGMENQPSMESGVDDSILATPRQTIRLGDERKVSVFYGTNRLAIEPHSNATGIAPFHVGFALFAVATMVGCFFLFPKQSSIRYGIASLIGMGAISTVALQVMLVMSWQLETRVPQRYTGIYSDEIQYGVCEVSIPESHQTGELESPQLLKFEVTQDPEKHIVLTHVQRMPIDSFRSALKAEMDRKGKNIFVFIHGYNVSFEDAARRTAQMSFDLKFEGAPVFYSWPSQAKWYSYVMDKENIANSTEQIRTFLMDIAKTSQADTINLIAHSMGNVGLTAALSEIEASSKPYFNQVVLAAPDIDADVFKNEIASRIVTKAHRTTLYTSKTDLALISSRYFNQRSRAGDSGPEVLVLDGIETIDATAVDSSLLGHSYYGSNISVLDDLSLLLKNKPIEARQYLKAIVQGAKPYWAFEPTRVSKAPATPVEISR